MIATERHKTIIEISKKVKDDRKNLDYLDRGMAYYQAGMNEILIAVAQNIYGDNHLCSQKTIQLSNEAEKNYNKLKSILPDEHHDLLLECDDAYRNWGTRYGEDEFINGFIACFNFFQK